MLRWSWNERKERKFHIQEWKIWNRETFHAFDHFWNYLRKQQTRKAKKPRTSQVAAGCLVRSINGGPLFREKWLFQQIWYKYIFSSKTWSHSAKKFVEGLFVTILTAWGNHWLRSYWYLPSQENLGICKGVSWKSLPKFRNFLYKNAIFTFSVLFVLVRSSIYMVVVKNHFSLEKHENDSLFAWNKPRNK